MFADVMQPQFGEVLPVDDHVPAGWLHDAEHGDGDGALTGAGTTHDADLKATYSAMPLLRGQFSKKYQQKAPHSSPVRARYGVSFVDPGSDWYSSSVSTIINAVSYYIAPRYNGTLLH